MLKQYIYSIAANWVMGGESIPIHEASFRSLLVDRDYERNNMPIIFLELAVPKNFLDKMVVNKANATINLTVQRMSADRKIREKYISGQFLYFLSNNANANYHIDYLYEQKKSNDDLYISTCIGMMSLDILNKHKSVSNYIYRNATANSIIAYNLRSHPLIMEGVNNVNYTELIIPPLASLSEFVSYMNHRNALYQTPYRYFMDYDRSYLLSSSRSSNIKVKGEKINKFSIEIMDPNRPVSKDQGFFTDTKNNLYRINVDGNECKPYKNNIQDKNITAITAITPSGSSKTVNIDSGESIGYSEKNRFIRLDNENTSSIDQVKAQMELSNNMITISKVNVDTSKFTMEKAYNIKHFSSSEISGDYLISRRKELYTRTNDYFNSELVLDFRKLK